MKILGNEIKPGMLIEHKDDLWEVLKAQHVKPGKGGALVVRGDRAGNNFFKMVVRRAVSFEGVFAESRVSKWSNWLSSSCGWLDTIHLFWLVKLAIIITKSSVT